MLYGDDKRKRCKAQGRVAEFVVRFCRPADYFYPRLAAMSGEDRLPLCIPCVNWQRRCTLGQRKRCQGQKPYLLMDHFALFMLEPGRVSVPDQRCMLRMVRGFLAEADGSSGMGVFPVPVQAMIGMLRKRLSVNRVVLTGENLLSELVCTWWDYNGRTVFFAHNLTAKMVRKMVKESGGAGGEPGAETEMTVETD